MRSSLSSILANLSLSAMTFFALAGVILFFPINLSNEHTCLLDYIVHAIVTASDVRAPHSHPGELLGRYLVPYGILWWLSIIAVVAVAVVWTRRSAKFSDTNFRKAR
jgi:hypothetical protein